MTAAVSLPAVAHNSARLPALRPVAAAALDVDPRTIIERWLAALSPSARRSYRRGLARFATWALADDARPERALEALCAMTVGQAGEMVRRWRDELLDEGLAPGTVAGAVTSITSLLATCRRAGLVLWRLERVAPRAERRLDRSGPRRGDVERLFATIDDAADTGDRQAIRDAALLRVLYVGAFRRAEVVGLRFPEDVNLEAADGPVVRPRRKGHRERKDVLISARCAQALTRWIEVRGADPGPLFRRTRAVDPSVPLSGESVRRALRRWAKAAGIKAAVRPHGLRHSSATTVAKRGSLAEVMAIGGWSSFSSAERYLDRRTEERRTALALVDV